MTTCEDTFLRAGSHLCESELNEENASDGQVLFFIRAVSSIARSFTFPTLLRQSAVVCSYLVLWFSICLVFHQCDVQFFVVFSYLLLWSALQSHRTEITLPSLVSPLYQDRSNSVIIRHYNINKRKMWPYGRVASGFTINKTFICTIKAKRQ